MNKKVLYYDDVQVGMELPELVKHPTARQLVKWAGASGDFYEAHYDKDFAQGSGLPGPIVHGNLVLSFLGQMMTDWIGEMGILRKLRCTFRGMFFPCQQVTCHGKVTRKYVRDGQGLVECEVWAENPKGEIPIPGTALVQLPTRV